MEDNCTICLNGFEKKSKLSNCLHEFCFDCIVEWYKNRKVCPVCLQKSDRMLFNIRGDSSYDEYVFSTGKVIKGPKVAAKRPEPTEVQKTKKEKLIISKIQRKIDKVTSKGDVKFTDEEIAAIATHFNELDLKNDESFRSDIFDIVESEIKSEFERLFRCIRENFNKAEFIALIEDLF